MIIHPQDEVAYSLVISIISTLNGLGVFIFGGRCRVFIPNGKPETLCLKVGEATEQAIHLRTTLLILARSVE